MTIEELKLKAALKQAAIDSCPGHIFQDHYISKIHNDSSSSACILCGSRMSWIDIEKLTNPYPPYPTK